MALKAIALNCTLKPSSGDQSSTDAMIGLLVSARKKVEVSFTETIRIPDKAARAAAMAAANAAHFANALKSQTYPDVSAWPNSRLPTREGVSCA